MSSSEWRNDQPLPYHVAMIMDGNGRWAQMHKLPRIAGHHAGAKRAEELIRFAGDTLNLPYLTLFALSAENWHRPKSEINLLMQLLDQFITDKLNEFVANNVRLLVIGDLSVLPVSLQRTIEHAIASTAGNSGLVLSVALNYGGRQEIIRACRKINAEITAGTIDPERLDITTFRSYLYAPHVPDPDLIIRTGGEQRISNFLIWQLAYAELYFTKTMWPDFTVKEFLQAISDFQTRDRRFGATEE
ncbi:isoprenyl transferase [Candidatus Acetothermia bacterium]|jgi:undecaprenyl diphosphate synthase|nr:isoprenyl transferase [Candidatus Acetothermia bacterium]MCI2426763.1 isoprenyl transferase [Candidatus Acetothermia bacterium]MCI2426882.1 isoprenyl transferase [Candidatus Acetothermia bacterium]